MTHLFGWLGLVVVAFLSLAVVSPVSAQASTPAVWCHASHISESWGQRANLFQTTNYCVVANGITNVWSIMPPAVSATITALGHIDGLSFDNSGIQYQNMCYPYNGRSRGYCEQYTFNIRYKQGFSALSTSYEFWTRVGVYYNGYAQCSNSIDRTWTKCS